MYTLRNALIIGLFVLFGLSWAQHPLAGQFLEPTIGFIIQFEELQGGQLGGHIIGQHGPTPLQMMANQQMAQGTFVLGGTRYGFTAQLESGTNLALSLYMVDASGMPVPSTYEYYTAQRQQVPQVQQPAPPQAGGFGAQPVTPSLNPIVGSWQGSMQAQGLTIGVFSSFREDGTYRDEAYIHGQLAAFYEGHYVLSPDGTLQQTITNKSPQLCVQGQCVPNHAPVSSTSRIAFHGMDAMTLTLMGDANQPPITASLQRTTRETFNPAVVAPGMTGGFTGGYSGGNHGGFSGYGTEGVGWDYSGGYTGGDSGTADFIQRGIWNEWTYANPTTGESYSLPYAPDPNYSYTSPSGNPLRYDESYGTWYEIDNYGFETQLETGP